MRKITAFVLGIIASFVLLQLIVLHMEGKETWVVEVSCDGGGRA